MTMFLKQKPSNSFCVKKEAITDLPRNSAILVADEGYPWGGPGPLA
jgi:hypothetical protein